MYVKTLEVIYLDSSGVENVPKEIEKFIKGTIGHKDIKTNMFRIQANNAITCGYFCSGFFNFMLKGKNLINYPRFFSLSEMS